MFLCRQRPSISATPALKMADFVYSFLERNSPFLVYNWQWVLLSAITVGILTLFIGKLFKKKQQPVIVQKEEEPRGDEQPRDTEHPMAEFRDTFTDLDNMEAPSLHPPDTPHIPYKYTHFTGKSMIKRSNEFYTLMNKRRSVRDYSTDDIPLDVINNIIKTAGTSPSGAHTEPWTFVVVKDKRVKAQVRNIIEQEEYLNYNHRMGDKWVTDLKFVGTDHQKPYLEFAPYLIIVFKQQYHVDDKGVRYAHYYYEISTAVACGFLVAAIHNAGLSTVVTTPLNAGGQLRELLGRPVNEKVMLLLPVGYPAKDAKVPDVGRKPMEDIMVIV